MKRTLENTVLQELTLHPTEYASPETDGFTGALYIPQDERFPGKVLIVVGGGDGCYALTRLYAEQFAKRGLAVLALPYWNEEGLPEAIATIPLELVELAALWLHRKGYKKIGIWGISTGAEYALLCASYLPELISCTIAVCPLSVCTQGIQLKTRRVKSMRLLDCSAFHFRGRPLPCASLSLSFFRILLSCIRHRSLTLLPCFKNVVQDAPEQTQIPVERISGPILLLCADWDTIWYSSDSAEVIQSRLETNGSLHRFHLFHYACASHYLVPCAIPFLRRLFAIERRYPDECARSNRDAFEKTIQFLKDW